MQWYYLDSSNQQQGPFSEDEFSAKVNLELISESTLVWNEGMDDWLPLGVSDFAPAVEAIADPILKPKSPRVTSTTPEPQAGTAICQHCQTAYRKEDLIAIAGKMVCANCKPLALQQMQEGMTHGNQLASGQFVDYGGFWIRFVAKILDGIILSIPNMVIGGGIGFMGAASGDQSVAVIGTIFAQLVGMMLGVGYSAFFIYKFQATPGKMAFGLQVVRPDGTACSLGQSIGRPFAEYISGITLGIGYVIAAFDDEKRSLHDHICGTRVMLKKK